MCVTFGFWFLRPAGSPTRGEGGPKSGSDSTLKMIKHLNTDTREPHKNQNGSVNVNAAALIRFLVSSIWAILPLARSLIDILQTAKLCSVSVRGIS